MTVANFLEASVGQVAAAVLLQGTHDQVIAEAKTIREAGQTVF